MIRRMRANAPWWRAPWRCTAPIPAMAWRCWRRWAAWRSAPSPDSSSAAPPPAGHRSVEPGQRLALLRLGLEPLIDLGLRLGEGSGAALAFPIVQAAGRLLTDVATFDEAAVSAGQAAAGAG
jgi:hypothetical protein